MLCQQLVLLLLIFIFLHTYVFIFIFIFYIYILLLPLLFFIFSTTAIRHNNLCNYSARLVLTILSSFFAYM